VATGSYNHPVAFERKIDQLERSCETMAGTYDYVLNVRAYSFVASVRPRRCEPNLLSHEFGFLVFFPLLGRTQGVSGTMSDIVGRRLESNSDRADRPPLTYSDMH
jgi:hypothetical protein